LSHPTFLRFARALILAVSSRLNGVHPAHLVRAMKETLSRVQQPRLVVLHDEHVVCIALNDFLGRFHPAMHSIGGDDAARNFKHLQQLKLLWIDQGKDAARGIVRRNTVQQREKSPKPFGIQMRLFYSPLNLTLHLCISRPLC
jgi:hypothetical protein